MKKLLIIASFALVCATSFGQPKKVVKAAADTAKKATDKYHDNVDDRMKGPKGEKVFIGPSGGRYYLTAAGNKVYVPLKKAAKKP